MFHRSSLLLCAAAATAISFIGVPLTGAQPWIDADPRWLNHGVSAGPDAVLASLGISSADTANGTNGSNLSENTKIVAHGNMAPVGSSKVSAATAEASYLTGTTAARQAFYKVGVRRNLRALSPKIKGSKSISKGSLIVAKSKNVEQSTANQFLTYLAAFPTPHLASYPTLLPSTDPSSIPTPPPTSQPTASPASHPTAVPTLRKTAAPSHQKASTVLAPHLSQPQPSVSNSLTFEAAKAPNSHKVPKGTKGTMSPSVSKRPKGTKSPKASVAPSQVPSPMPKLGAQSVSLSADACKVPNDICTMNPGLSCCTTTNSKCLIYETGLKDSIVDHELHVTYPCVDPNTKVTCSISGPNGDADMYVFLLDSAPSVVNGCSSIVDQTSVGSCEVVTPPFTTSLKVAILAYDVYSRLTLICNVANTTEPYSKGSIH